VLFVSQRALVQETQTSALVIDYDVETVCMYCVDIVLLDASSCERWAVADQSSLRLKKWERLDNLKENLGADLKQT